MRKARHSIVSSFVCALFALCAAPLIFPGAEIIAQSSSSRTSSQTAQNPLANQSWKIVFERNMIARSAFMDGSAPHNIFVVNADSKSTEIKLTNDNLSTNPVWSPDGRRIAFVRGGYYGGVFVMDADGANVRQVSEILGARMLAWSPNLRYLAFDMGPGARYIGQLNLTDYPMYLIDLESDAPARRLLSNGISPSWSPDSNQIAYTCVHTVNANEWYPAVCIVSLDQVPKPHTLIERARTPMWSPDGQRILYLSTANTKPQLFVCSPDGSGRLSISDGRYDAIEAAWSPDGKRIAFTATRSMDGYSASAVYFEADATKIPEGGMRPFSEKVPELFVINSDGTRVIHLGAKESLWCNQFSWSPNSDLIAGICGTGLTNASGFRSSLISGSVLLLNPYSPNSKPRVIAHGGVESINSALVVTNHQ